METSPKTPKILIVDDEPANVRLLNAMCAGLRYDTLTAANGKEAVAMASLHLPDLVLMDVMMPEMNGFEATTALKADKATCHIPVIIVTALDSRDDRLAGIALGADDFLSKPIDSEELGLRIKNLLNVKAFGDLLQGYNSKLEAEVEKRTISLQDAYTRLETANQQVKIGYLEAIDRLARASEYKDEDTGLHLRRVSAFVRALAEELGLNDKFCTALFYAAPMHDVGKVGIPDRIILKVGGLDADEWRIMQTHPTIGAKILAGSQSEYLRVAEEIAQTHHERWDGSGYPQGLKGKDIPLAGRLMNLADQYDALRSKRPYKPAFDHPKTCSIICQGDGRTLPGHFDPAVLKVFGRRQSQFAEIYETLRAEECA